MMVGGECKPSIRERVSRWYSGRPVENDPNSYVVFLGLQYSPSARVVRSVVAFCSKEWKWIIGTMIALLALFVAA